jgi:hypothetical protein
MTPLSQSSDPLAIPPVAQPAPAGRSELRDLMWMVFGIDCFAAGLMGYLALILLLAIHDLRAAATCLLLGALLFAAGAIPRWFPQWLSRVGIDNPLLLNPH